MNNVSKKFKKISRVVYWVVSVVIFSVTVLTLLTLTALPGGISAYVVQTGSMSPTIPAGSMIFIQAANDYSVGEVVTFSSKLAGGESKLYKITHRIVGTEIQNGNVRYVTKGDANDTDDGNLIAQKDIIGKTLFNMPYIGSIIEFARTKHGFLLLVLFPVLIILYREIKVLHFELNRKFGNRKQTPL